MNDWIVTNAPIIIIAVPLFAAFLTPLTDRINAKVRNAVVFIAVLATLAITLILAKNVFDNGLVVYTLGGGSTGITLPSGYHVPVRIILEADGMSVFMAIISALISFVGMLYSFSYIKGEGSGKYYTLFLIMLVGMLGMEMTGDLFNLFVFLEILSVSSAALIAFYTRKGEPLEASIKYIIISSLAALFVLFAIGLLYGKYDLLNMGALADKLISGGTLPIITQIAFVLLFASFALKAGAAPMHMWLPDAYGEAPGAISMVLVAATQASLYALLRVCFTVYGVSIDASTVGILLVALGLISIFIGVTMALVQIDIKRLIGYAAVAEIGYILIAIGAAFFELSKGDITNYGLKAMEGGIFHIFNDVLDIGLLFMVAGAIIYATKESNMNRLGGLAHSMKYTSIFFIIGMVAVSGLPPLNGFASKILIYESVYKVSPIISIIAILASMLMLAIFVKIFHSVFMGPKLPEFASCKDSPVLMIASMTIIAATMIFFGLFPNFVVNNIVDPAVNALLNQAGYITSVMGGA